MNATEIQILFASLAVIITRYTVDNDQGAVRHTQSGRHLRREVNVPRRVDQVDEEGRETLLARLSDRRQILLWQRVVQRNSTAMPHNNQQLLKPK